MQCHRLALRAVCRATNAYDPSRALRSAFGTATPRRESDDRIPSAWEPTEWDELPNAGRQQEIADVQDGGPNTEHEGSPTASTETKKTTSKQDVRATSGERKHMQIVRRIKTRAQGNEAAKTEVTSLQQYVQGILRRQVARAEAFPPSGRGDVPATAMSDERLWLPHLNGKLFVGADKWQPEIVNLALLNRRLHEDKHYTEEWSPHEKGQIGAAFDYRPRVVQPRTPVIGEDVLPPAPWETSPKGRREGNLRGIAYAEHEFEKAIARFVNHMKPTPLETFARKTAAKEVMSFIQETLRGHQNIAAELQGSEKTGLAMPTSDIDIRVWEQSDEEVPHRAKPYVLGKRILKSMRPLEYALRKHPERFVLVTFRDGLHPIINFQHRPSGLDFQIVAGRPSYLQEDAVAKYLSEIPQLRALFTVVRTFFDVRGLLPVYSGGIGSYGCFVMLIPPILRAKKTLSAPVLSLLRRVFAFYHPCNVVDPTNHGVSCFPRQIFKKHDPDHVYDIFARYAERRGDPIRAGQWRIGQRRKYLPYLLTLQDPANPNNDLGARTYAIKHILATFMRARRDLRRWKVRMARDPQTPYEPFLEQLVGRPDLLYREQRQALEEYGRAVKDGKEPSYLTEDEDAQLLHGHGFGDGHKGALIRKVWE